MAKRSRTSDSMPHIWERLDTDTNKSWGAFQFYRDMPPSTRSLVAAYKLWASVYVEGFDPSQYQAAGPPGNWGKWSSEHDWEIRVAAYDRYLDVKATERNEADHGRELENYRTRELVFSRMASRAALEMLEKALEAVEGLEIEDIRPQDLPKILVAIAQLYDKASEAERRALAVDKILETLRESGALESQPIRH